MSQAQVLSITGQTVSLPADKLPAALAHCEREIVRYHNDIRAAVQMRQKQSHIDGLRATVAKLVAMRDSINAAIKA